MFSEPQILETHEHRPGQQGDSYITIASKVP